MGRIGRSYPRFEEVAEAPAAAAERRANSASQVLGAIVGILGALGLIAWLLSR
jgi:hypothetical protein